MKQTYVKPSIIVERFALTQSIASSCGVVGGSTLGKPTHQSKEVCGWELMNGLVLFVDAVSACTKDVEPDAKVDGVCYNNPDGAMIFSSF